MTGDGRIRFALDSGLPPTRAPATKASSPGARPGRAQPEAALSLAC